ncbi:V-type ATP synthase subunit D [Oscillospiraceae bacterium OttesenSCG-928-F05]|nr:V-type ATP synthase subunit D [Oscillospiraceae bacterium OttesenSCG-928-F05]
MAAIIPTKGNLIARKRSLQLAEMGFELMDRKRNILIREMMGMIDRAAEIQGQIAETFGEAYKALQTANITLGVIDAIASTVPVDDSLVIHYRSIMGVEIPTIPDQSEMMKMPYGFHDTNSALDEAFVKFQKVKTLCRTLAEVETTIYRLAFAIKKTQKRANALENIIIPNFTGDVKFITEALEEKDREEFARLKVIKAQKAK